MLERRENHEGRLEYHHLKKIRQCGEKGYRKKKKVIEHATHAIRDKVQGLLIVGYFIVQSCQVESVQDEIFIDFAKVFVPFG